MEIQAVQLLNSPVASFHSVPNISLSNLLSIALNICTHLNVTAQVLHPNNTTDETVVLQILILIFLESKLEDERLWTGR